jgi:hypothetical protein
MKRDRGTNELCEVKCEGKLDKQFDLSLTSKLNMMLITNPVLSGLVTTAGATGRQIFVKIINNLIQPAAFKRHGFLEAQRMESMKITNFPTEAAYISAQHTCVNYLNILEYNITTTRQFQIMLSAIQDVEGLEQPLVRFENLDETAENLKALEQEIVRWGMIKRNRSAPPAVPVRNVSVENEISSLQAKIHALQNYHNNNNTGNGNEKGKGRWNGKGAGMETRQPRQNWDRHQKDCFAADLGVIAAKKRIDAMGNGCSTNAPVKGTQRAPNTNVGMNLIHRPPNDNKGSSVTTFAATTQDDEYPGVSAGQILGLPPSEYSTDC